MENLDPDYLRFIENNGSLKHLTQEIIDRVQYSTGFFNKLTTLIDEYESPFEFVEEDGQVIRKLKIEFHNQNLQQNVA